MIHPINHWSHFHIVHTSLRISETISIDRFFPPSDFVSILKKKTFLGQKFEDVDQKTVAGFICKVWSEYNINLCYKPTATILGISVRLFFCNFVVRSTFSMTLVGYTSNKKVVGKKHENHSPNVKVYIVFWSHTF